MADLVIIEIIMMIRGISFVISLSTLLDESLVPGGKLLTVRSYSGQLSEIFMDLHSSIGQWQKMNGNVVLLGTTYHFSKKWSASVGWFCCISRAMESRMMPQAPSTR